MTAFPGKSRTINIAAEIGMNYQTVGTALLKDYTGVKIPSIVMANMMQPVSINLEILRQWMQSSLASECTWKIFVKVLRENQCEALADDIEAVVGKC